MSVEKQSDNLPITVFFKHNGKIAETRAERGKTLLEIAHDNEIPLEGACEGSLACSTCHVYCPRELFKNDPFFAKEISDKENDLLDKAYRVRENSRLGCQIKANDKLNNMTFEIPKATVNMAVDGHVPKPH
ncbi:ADRX [Enterospora canceri]|uniref:ADRX n=1 Tax=Enterospora canceri TaxID=1081671 RepID=A0A1Y1S6M7_9MICR|nr:ADRX [Enterospora canceri]